MELEPWGMVNHLYPDLVLVVEGRSLMYHQAVVAQHSSLLKDLLLRTGCCKCQGEHCRRVSGDVVVSLTDVTVAQVQYVMDVIYNGGGSIAGDVAAYKEILRMLAIDTVMLEDVKVQEGFVFEKEAEAEVERAASPQVSIKNADSSKVAESERKRKKADESRRKKQEKEKLRKRLEEEKGERKMGEEEQQQQTSKAEKSLDLSTFLSPGIPNKTFEAKNSGLTMVKMPDRAGMGMGKHGDKPVISATRVSIEIDDEEVEIIGSEKRAEKVVEERFSCPFTDCSSESRSAQSIKVHLALVHYKKEIQADFPNWRTQKCEQCDRSFGQMTAYYLHMAQHKAYPHMEGSSANPSAPPGPPGPMATPIPTPSWPSSVPSKIESRGRSSAQMASSVRSAASEEPSQRSFGQNPSSYSQYRRISLTSPSPSSKSQPSSASGLTREHQGSPGFTRTQQGSPGLTRTQQGSPRVSTQQFGSPGLSKARQGSPAFSRTHQSASEFMKSQQSSHSGPSGPGLVNVVQGSPGDKASKRKPQGEGGNKSGGGGGKRGPYQRR